MKRKVTTYYSSIKLVMGKVQGQKQRHTSAIHRVTVQFLVSHRLSHFDTLSKLKYSLVYTVITQITLTLATFLKRVKTNDFHMTDNYKHNFPIGKGGRGSGEEYFIFYSSIQKTDLAIRQL